MGRRLVQQGRQSRMRKLSVRFLSFPCPLIGRSCPDECGIDVWLAADGLVLRVLLGNWDQDWASGAGSGDIFIPGIEGEAYTYCYVLDLHCI